jgi:tight adherence protein B
VIGALLALCFAAGVGLLVVGLSREPEEVDLARWRERLLSRRESMPLPALPLGGLSAALALIAAVFVWSLVGVPVLALAAAIAGAYAPVAWAHRAAERARRERERAWPAALAQLSDALEAGIAFPAAVSLLGEAGPVPLRAEFTSFQARLRAAGLEAALDGLARAGERTSDTVALLLRAGLLELPAGRLAPLLRELSEMLAERFEAREKARTRASSLQVEAAVLALSPIVLLLLLGAASPGYLDAYKTAAGTIVATVGSALIFGCYLMMRRLGRVPEPRRTRTPR